MEGFKAKVKGNTLLGDIASRQAGALTNSACAGRGVRQKRPGAFAGIGDQLQHAAQLTLGLAAGQPAARSAEQRAAECTARISCA